MNTRSEIVKTIIYIILSMSVICCDKLFYEEEDTVQTIEMEAEIVAHLHGSYGALANIFQPFAYIRQILYGDDITWRSNSEHFILDTTTIIYCSSGKKSRCIFYLPYDPIDPLSDPICPINKYLWHTLYKSIIEANNIIVQIHPSSDLSQSSCEMLGEAYFLRAICYFRLLRIFGRIPLVSGVDIDYTLEKPSYIQIYDFIILDLQKASNLLLTSNNKTRIPYVTPCQGAAKALLAEVYLSMAGYPLKDRNQYAMAANVAGQVIDSAEYYGFKLVSDFADLWTNSVANNDETVFPIYIPNTYIQTPYSYNKGYAYKWRGTYELGKMQRENYSLFHFYPETDASPEIEFYNTFPAGYRKNETYNTHQFLGFAITNEKRVVRIDTVMNQVPWCYGGLYFRKMPYPKIISTDIDSNFDFDGFSYIPERSDNDPPFIIETEANRKFYLLRYAHTLLTYAEAKARSGQLDASAYEAVNMIRRRANKVDIYSPSVYDLQPGLSAEQFADSVVWERAWEFAGEPEGRWFDLMRLEMAEDLPELRDPQEYEDIEYPVTKEDYFMPIPEEDIWLNPNLE